MALDIPLPTAAPEDDPLQYIPLLLSAIEGFLLARDVWEPADYDTARQYMEQLQSYIVEVMEAAMYGSPIGQISAWSVASIPTRWLKCDGQSLLRASYPALFAILGTTYGAVDGTHFSLPDYREYSLMGAGSTVAIGGNAGAFLHAISPSEMPTHNHGVTDPGHTHGVNTQSGGGAGANNVIVASVANVSTTPVVKVSNSATTGITTNNAGSSTPMSLLHPVRGVHFIIYAGV